MYVCQESFVQIARIPTVQYSFRQNKIKMSRMRSANVYVRASRHGRSRACMPLVKPWTRQVKHDQKSSRPGGPDPRATWPVGLGKSIILYIWCFEPEKI